LHGLYCQREYPNSPFGFSFKEQRKDTHKKKELQMKNKKSETKNDASSLWIENLEQKDKSKAAKLFYPYPSQTQERKIARLKIHESFSLEHPTELFIVKCADKTIDPNEIVGAFVLTGSKPSQNAVLEFEFISSIYKQKLAFDIVSYFVHNTLKRFPYDHVFAITTSNEQVAILKSLEFDFTDDEIQNLLGIKPTIIQQGFEKPLDKIICNYTCNQEGE